MSWRRKLWARWIRLWLTEAQLLRRRIRTVVIGSRKGWGDGD